MVYAGYVPAKLPPSKLSDAEAAAYSVESMESLEIVGKLLYNCAVSPKEEKYRAIRLSNEKIKSTIVSVPGAMDTLKAMGWVESSDNPEMLIIPGGKYISMKEVRIIEAAKERLAKALREKASRVGASPSA